jgi:hypothetical protein
VQELNANPYGEDLHQPTCARREIPTPEQLVEMAAAAAAAEGAEAPSVEVMVDTLHVYGVDRLSTDEILKYFDDYAPSYVLWLDDSSANLVFGDVANARRALFSLGQPIRLPAQTPAPAEGEMADAEQAPKTAAEAVVDSVWRRGPNYEKGGFEYAVLIRQAVSTDAKKGKPQKSKRLWMEGEQGRRGRGGYPGGGAYGSGDYRGDRMRNARSAHVPRQREAPMEDLRASLGKAKKERRGRKQRYNPYGMEVDAQGCDEEVQMMDAAEAERIMSAPVPAAGSAGEGASELTAEEQMMLEGATAAADTMAE